MCAVHADAPAVQAPKTGKRAPRVDSSQPNRVRRRYTTRSSTRMRTGSPVVAEARLCICIDSRIHFRLTLGQALEEACQTDRPAVRGREKTSAPTAHLTMVAVRKSRDGFRVLSKANFSPLRR